MKLAKPGLHYESAVIFFQSLRISFRHGMDLIERRILVPDASFNAGKHLFLADAVSREKHKQAVNAYKATIREAQENLVEA
jgi:hypothetical protein